MRLMPPRPCSQNMSKPRWTLTRDISTAYDQVEFSFAEKDVYHSYRQKK